MLSEEAMPERKWGNFATLEKVLGNKPIPESYFGLTSISDNGIESLVRLVEVAVLARAYKDAVVESARSLGRMEMVRDLEHLMWELKGVSGSFRNKAEEIEAICRELYSR